VAKLWSCVIAASELAKHLSEVLDLGTPSYCYLDLAHALVFERWEPSLAAKHDLADYLLAGRLFGANAELQLRRCSDGKIRCLWLSDDGVSPPVWLADTEYPEALSPLGDDTTAILWGKPLDGAAKPNTYFETRVGAHEYPVAGCYGGSPPQRVAVKVRTYAGGAGEAVAYRWVALIPHEAAGRPVSQPQTATEGVQCLKPR